MTTEAMQRTSEQPTPISALEKKLLDRELELMQREIEKGLKIISNVLGLYMTEERGFGVSEGAMAKHQMIDFIGRMFPTHYYAGDWLNVATSSPKIPEFLHKAILEKAIEDHLEAVDRIQEVAE